MEGIIRAWGRILNGYKPNLSIEVTRECPLRCSQCGCMAAAGLGAVGRHRLPGGVMVGTVFELSERVGRRMRRVRERFVAAAT
ncbi:MAG: hypothetical protein AB1714_06575 [Acidobacteriota bacterium]